MDDGEALEGIDGGSHPPRGSSDLTLAEQSVVYAVVLASQLSAYC